MDTLRKLRVARGLSQAEVAEIIAVRQRTISKWEKLQQLPNIADAVLLARCYNTDLLRIAQALGIDTSDINNNCLDTINDVNKN
ncbi:helix-turn-helix transcriptional regulator [Geminocystis sp. NIES-3709]|uniref:helix-turn-helix domain-containing protein n=1 Tax=Geminocystis sp. NIES-3709 TaxID=1617448 RepID=UPI0005FCD584|nr:helix-turn-helix transcriptional regulator [Geminocystis sp. NIES-3709]BAQ67104.1 hypothetical protein GM3709_3869 [Geminocystis sp. NIES-3709]